MYPEGGIVIADLNGNLLPLRPLDTERELHPDQITKSTQIETGQIYAAVSTATNQEIPLFVLKGRYAKNGNGWIKVLNLNTGLIYSISLHDHSVVPYITPTGDKLWNNSTYLKRIPEQLQVTVNIFVNGSQVDLGLDHIRLLIALGKLLPR